MSQRNNRNEILQTFLGILLLLGCHIIAIIIIVAVGYILEASRPGNYAGIQFWIIAGIGFLFWQLLYVIPLCIVLRRQQRIAMRNGVVIGAAITALLNGGCFLLMNIRF
jgi:hypothetical protein